MSEDLEFMDDDSLDLHGLITEIVRRELKSQLEDIVVPRMARVLEALHTEGLERARREGKE